MEKLIRLFSWLKIVASPTILGTVLAALFYLYKPNVLGICIASLIFLTGLILGIKWANAISRKMDPTDFNARVMATPELDNLSEQLNSKVKE